jgi:predicted nucleic acid-binding protein
MILLLDNTVLSNLSLVNKLELLPKALGSQVATTRQVIHEYQEGVAKGLLPEA